MIKVIWPKFQWCLGPFTMLLVEASSETELFRHLSDYLSEIPNFENKKLSGSSFFSKFIKFQKCGKISEKRYFFWDNCIWIGFIKLSLLRRGYFSSAANVLKGSPKIFHVNKRDFFQLNWLGNGQWIWLRCSDGDFNSAYSHLPCCLLKGPLKRDF